PLNRNERRKAAWATALTEAALGATSMPSTRPARTDPNLTQPTSISANLCKQDPERRGIVRAMSRTTLSVPTHVRDTFAAVAASRNTTMLALLDEAASRLEREEAMRQATESYERLAQDDPEAFAAYL